jgi:hypothetical protein
MQWYYHISGNPYPSHKFKRYSSHNVFVPCMFSRVIVGIGGNQYHVDIHDMLHYHLEHTCLIVFKWNILPHIQYATSPHLTTHLLLFESNSSTLLYYRTCMDCHMLKVNEIMTRVVWFFFFFKEPLIRILTSWNLFKGSLGGGLNLVFPIFKLFNLNFSTSFQIQKPFS